MVLHATVISCIIVSSIRFITVVFFPCNAQCSVCRKVGVVTETTDSMMLKLRIRGLGKGFRKYKVGVY